MHTLPLDPITEPIARPALPAGRPRRSLRKPARATHRAPTSRWSLTVLQLLFIALGLEGIAALFHLSGAHLTWLGFLGSYHW